jgi:putative ABC transport system permease protein
MRSFLTMLGIIIGVSSVIAVVAIGQGGRVVLEKEMDAFGANRFLIFYKETDSPLSDADIFTVQDIKAIKKLSSAIDCLAPVNWDTSNIRNKGRSIKVSIIATTEDYRDISDLKLAQGRFLNEDDNDGKKQVGVINYDLAKELFGSTNAVGKKIMLKNRPFYIVGVLEKGDSMLSQGQDDKVLYMPISTLHSLTATNWIDSIDGKAVSREDVDKAISQAINILERRHRKEDRYQAFNAEKEIDTVRNVTGIVALVISIIAGISLLVGGIGIMNIMLVSVTERTREIGIRKALGARESDILTQFLIESLVISVIGGIIGMLLGFGISLIIAKFAKMPPFISWQMVTVAFSFSAIVGVFFGMYPAKKAARLDPIEALRYE